MNEIFSDIKDYPNYKVSNLGYVISIKGTEPRVLKMFPDKDGYLKVSLCHNCKQKTFPIHRLVASIFVDNPNCYETVDHKDGNKKNNRVDNLVWMSRRNNVQKYHEEKGHNIFDVPKLRGLRKRGETKRIPIKQYTKEGVFVNEFISLMDAERKTGIRNSSISNCLSGRKSMAGGYIWKRKQL